MVIGNRMSGPPRLAVASACVGGVATAAYAGLRVAEGAGSLWQNLPWLALMVAGVVGAASGAAVRRRNPRRGLLGGSTVVFGLVGLSNVYGVGIGFLLAAILAAVAWGSRSTTASAAAHHQSN